MKRFGDLYDRIISIENLYLADQKARKGKTNTYGVILHDKDRDQNILSLHQTLKEKSFKTSEYKIFTIKDPKEREIYKLPYYPDRILHHAIMNVMESIWLSIFTSDTFSCIKHRGINGCRKKVVRALKDKEGTKYCLKIDVKKFYPNIDHEILKQIIRKKIKCQDTLNLLDQIIDSAPGVPIGNYLSQYFANLYLAYFDHYIKEVAKVKYYFRYADDMVFLHSEKNFLHGLLININDYLESNLNLTLKSNFQIFPIEKRGLDFVGFVFYHSHTAIRKGIKKNFCRKAAKLNQNENITLAQYKMNLCSWLGWIKYSDSKNLLKSIIKPEFYGNIRQATANF